ncbi:hypothetical protein A2799_04875 [Candidatus Roizmanbacteria bacterium RIFCSPHIGHO2_01_FULL_39_24]|uniref:Glycosyltransferase RgtA/B/C/D-like domain-containing protein n=1 Tax=Candidatus Roizmanbacteria bacterium RIFCSPHIGHO2_01_FULL_39_24 TaxID=1802032 RepID=A0A1F7GKN6_9BACT|nr:MAG: hypothetical protein A2799_04875 [Candidatus Roizmanbacteria bacterium RIFCSPHIGHO2_01_FULL_39_24]
MKNKVSLIILTFIILGGLWFRFVGIEKNLSFWNDESHAAIYSRGVAQTGLPVDTQGRGRGIYQVGLYYVTGASFKLFGISQTAGRLPSIVVGTLLIGIVYLVSRKVSTSELVALTSAFLVSFSQIQLAWSTQLRPYIWLELFSILVFYFAIQSLNSKKKIFDRQFISAAILGSVSYLFHPIGFFNIIFLFFIFAYKSIIAKKIWYLLALIPLAVLTYLLIYFSIGQDIEEVIKFVTQIHTDTLHYRVFLRANYDWLIFGTFVGVIGLFQRNKQYAFVLSGFIFIIFFLAIFKINASYVRYCLPAFPLLYILFSFGIEKITKHFVSLTKNEKLFVPFFLLIFAILIYFPIQKSKILLNPRYFYTINGDMRENPIVDYAIAFDKIRKMISGKKSVILMDAWNDRIPWYLPDQEYIFLTKNEKYIDPTFNEKMVGTIAGFESEKKRYQSGVVLVENWESLTPPDLQKHIRDTLTRKFDVENLPYNEADKWSISIYTWGL